MMRPTFEHMSMLGTDHVGNVDPRAHAEHCPLQVAMPGATAAEGGGSEVAGSAPGMANPHAEV